jgi:hypothetical protein
MALRMSDPNRPWGQYIYCLDNKEIKHLIGGLMPAPMERQTDESGYIIKHGQIIGSVLNKMWKQAKTEDDKGKVVKISQQIKISDTTKDTLTGMQYKAATHEIKPKPSPTAPPGQPSAAHSIDLRTARDEIRKLKVQQKELRGEIETYERRKNEYDKAAEEAEQYGEYAVKNKNMNLAAAESEKARIATDKLNRISFRIKSLVQSSAGSEHEAAKRIELIKNDLIRSLRRDPDDPEIKKRVADFKNKRAELSSAELLTYWGAAYGRQPELEAV